MLMDLLDKAVTAAMLGFVVSSMLAMGSGLTIRQIIEPLRNPRLVLLALLANFVLMPLGALALAKALWLDNPFAVGLLVLGCAAGAPFLPKARRTCQGQPRIFRWRDGASDDRHGRLPACRHAHAAPGGHR
jgi:BASS family bile acid:Na+ symporter